MQINLSKILNEPNSSFLEQTSNNSKSYGLFEYVKKIKKQSEDCASEEEKQKKMSQILNKLKNGKKLTAEEMAFLRKYNPTLYQRALRIQKMTEQLENQLKQAKSKEEANNIIAYSVNAISDEDPDKEILTAAFGEVIKKFRSSRAYQKLPNTIEDAKKQKNQKNAQEFDSDKDEEQNLLSWTPLQEIIDSAPTLQLKG